MPYYSYLCDDCKQQFIVQRSISDRDDVAKCAHCDRESVQRLLSLPMVYSRGSDGQTRAVAGAGSACGSCATTSGCGSCSSN